MRTISRQELFEDVWTRPLTKIAPEFGVTDVGLRKICSRHDIPTPLRGYWAKVAAGMVFPRPKLRPARTPSREMITIEGTRPPAAEVQAAIERVRAVRASHAEHARAEPSRSEDAPAQPAAPDLAQPGRDGAPLPAAINGPSQAPPAPEPNRYAQRTQDRLASAKGSGLVNVGGKGLFKVTATVEQAERVGHILAQLVSAVEAMGWKVDSLDGGLRLVPDREPITFDLTERTDRVKHTITAAEQTALQKHEERRERAARRGEWFSDWDKPKIPEWDHVPNGLLTLNLHTGLYRQDRIRRRFSDTKHQRIERMMDHVIASLAAYAASEKAARVRRERERLEAIEAQKRWEEAERRRKLEEKRLEFLQAQMKRLDRVREIEAFVREIEAAGQADGAVAAFLVWSQQRARRLRKALSHEVLKGKLEQLDLMNDQARIDSWVKVD